MNARARERLALRGFIVYKCLRFLRDHIERERGRERERGGGREREGGGRVGGRERERFET